MLKKITVMLFLIVLVCSMSTPGFAKGDTKGDKKEGRVEGRVVRHSNESSTLTVRLSSDVGQVEKTVHYDNSTAWTSRYHRAKKVNTIDASQIKDGDYVICLGWYDDKNEFHAATVSKRLSHSPQ